MNREADLRYTRTENALMNAIAKLLSEKPIDRITVEEIAEMSQINRVTFYKHYYDKYALAAIHEKGIYLSELEQSALLGSDFKAGLVKLIHTAQSIMDRISGIETANPFYRCACKGELRNAIFETLGKYITANDELSVTLNQSMMSASIVFDAAQIMAENNLGPDSQFASQAADAIIRGLKTGQWLVYCGESPTCSQ